jgi:hypothetical protein
MRVSAGAASGDGSAAAGRAVALDAMFRPPRVRPGIVPRTALVDRLSTGPFTQVISVNAPAGYGMTTLLARSAARDGRELAWVSSCQKLGVSSRARPAPGSACSTGRSR